jgi:hypothetical protein
MAGWNALDEAHCVELLITRVDFSPGKPNGISLARMARYKRPTIQVVFTALPEFAEYTDGLVSRVSNPSHQGFANCIWSDSA